MQPVRVINTVVCADIADLCQLHVCSYNGFKDGFKDGLLHLDYWLESDSTDINGLPGGVYK